MTDSRRGLLAMLLSSVFFAAMAALIRGVEGLNAYTMVMARFIIGTLACVGIYALGLDRMRWRNWPWIVARGLSGGFAVTITYWAIRAIGLGKAQMLAYTYVMFAAVLAVPILRERLSARQWLAVAMAMLGVALLCNVQEFSVSAAEFVALLGGLLGGFAVVCITHCRATDSSTNIFLSQSVFGLFVAAWPAAASWTIPIGTQWLWLVAIGLLATGGQLLMTYAYKHTGASQGSLLSLLCPALSALVGVFYFGEPATVSFAAGSALILLACAYMAFNPVVQVVRGQ